MQERGEADKVLDQSLCDVKTFRALVKTRSTKKRVIRVFCRGKKTRSKWSVSKQNVTSILLQMARKELVMSYGTNWSASLRS